MRFCIALTLTFILMILLPGSITNAQDDNDLEALPLDVATEIQAEMDHLTAGGLPPGMVV